MESETLTRGHRSNVLQRVLASAVPVVWIAISYVDPGKWAATVEGGARFGFDVVSLMLMFNCVAILCQYLSARIAVVTGKDLTQICSEEYDNITCVFLGIQAEISIIALDLMMVLGTAYGLNAIFGIDLFNCVFLTGIDAILFPFLATLLENSKAKFLSVCLTILILLFYVFGVLISQPESSFSMGGMLTKLSGESAYALMSLLGASIMPHNFYLHSSIVPVSLSLSLRVRVLSFALAYNLCFGFTYACTLQYLHAVAVLSITGFFRKLFFHDACTPSKLIIQFLAYGLWK